VAGLAKKADGFGQPKLIGTEIPLARCPSRQMGLPEMCASPTPERVPYFAEHLQTRLDAAIRILQAGDVLFRRAEARTHLYLVERGTIALYRKRSERAQDIVEFAFAGDVVGFGFLPRHTFWAVALSTSRVKLLELAEGDKIVRRSERSNRRYREAIEREFVARREELVAAYRSHPVRRVACFLLAISKLNRDEGRDASLITDSLTCGTVAACLELDLDTLARALLELQQMRLVAYCPPSGLQLTDFGGLCALAQEAPRPAPL
jgi:CRP/FNR family transcriptional regulator, anaerobic regulatory protein